MSNVFASSLWPVRGVWEKTLIGAPRTPTCEGAKDVAKHGRRGPGSPVSLQGSGGSVLVCMHSGRMLPQCFPPLEQQPDLLEAPCLRAGLRTTGRGGAVL